MSSVPSTSAVPARNGRPSHAVGIIIAAFIGAVIFTLGGGAVLYLNTQNLTGAAERVQHTQDVLSSLQRGSLLAERVLYRSRIYASTGDEDEFILARGAADNLVTSASHIHALVADNPSQAANSKALAECAARLSEIMKQLSQHSALPTAEVQECQKSISLKAAQEQ